MNIKTKLDKADYSLRTNYPRTYYITATLVIILAVGAIVYLIELYKFVEKTGG